MRKILSTYLLPLGLLTFTLISPNITIGQVDVLEQIEAELNAEKEKQKALQKAEKNMRCQESSTLTKSHGSHWIMTMTIGMRMS